MLRFVRTLVSVPLLAAALVLQSAGAPLASLAAVPQNVTVAITAIPGNYVTLNHFVAFDVTVTNGSGSTVAQLSIVDSVTNGAIYSADVTGGTVAGQTACTTNGSLSCYAGNLADGATLQLRVVYIATATGVLTAEFIGNSTGTPGGNVDGGSSHGDTFDGSYSLNVFNEFDASTVAGQTTQGYIPDAGDTLQTSVTDRGTAANPLWTGLHIPAGSNKFLASVAEGAAPSSLAACATRNGCFGQATELHINNGATIAPFTVDILVDNAKSWKSLSQWNIFHYAGSSTTGDLLPACSSTIVVNCVLSKGYSASDRNDYVATIVLNQNGWIRNG